MSLSRRTARRAGGVARRTARTPPRVILTARRPARRGPVAGGPLLAADDRRRLVASLHRSAEDSPGPADKSSLSRRHVDLNWNLVPHRHRPSPLLLTDPARIQHQAPLPLHS